jgi:hypothetical protein
VLGIAESGTGKSMQVIELRVTVTRAGTELGHGLATGRRERRVLMAADTMCWLSRLGDG